MFKFLEQFRRAKERQLVVARELRHILIQIPWCRFQVTAPTRDGTPVMNTVSRTTVVFSQERGIRVLENTQMVEPDKSLENSVRIQGHPDRRLYPAVMIRYCDNPGKNSPPDEVLICLAQAQPNAGGQMQPVLHFGEGETGPRILYERKYEGNITLFGSDIKAMQAQVTKLAEQGRRLACEIRDADRLLIYSTDQVNHPLLGVPGLVVVLKDPTGPSSPVSVSFKMDSRMTTITPSAYSDTESLTVALPSARKSEPLDPEMTVVRPTGLGRPVDISENEFPIKQITTWFELMAIYANHSSLQEVYRSPGPGEEGPVQIPPVEVYRILQHLGRLVHETDPDQFDASNTFMELPRSFGRQHVLDLFNQERKSRNLPEFVIRT